MFGPRCAEWEVINLKYTICVPIPSFLTIVNKCSYFIFYAIRYMYALCIRFDAASAASAAVNTKFYYVPDPFNTYIFFYSFPFIHYVFFGPKR